MWPVLQHKWNNCATTSSVTSLRWFLRHVLVALHYSGFSCSGKVDGAPWSFFPVASCLTCRQSLTSILGSCPVTKTLYCWPERLVLDKVALFGQCLLVQMSIRKATVALTPECPQVWVLWSVIAGCKLCAGPSFCCFALLSVLQLTLQTLWLSALRPELLLACIYWHPCYCVYVEMDVRICMQ